MDTELVMLIRKILLRAVGPVVFFLMWSIPANAGLLRKIKMISMAPLKITTKLVRYEVISVELLYLDMDLPGSRSLHHSEYLLREELEN